MYYFLLFIFYPLSLLPFRVLYFISDFAFLLIFHVFKYRRTVVAENLSYAFPEKSAKERLDIERKFYRNLCDQLVETIKLISISKAELNKRFTGDWHIADNYFKKQKNVYALIGHQFNWEWANVIAAWNCPQTYAGIYLPLNSSAVNRLMLRIRQRSNAVLISAKNLKQNMEQLHDKIYVLAIVADQSPGETSIKWLSFMNRVTPFFLGPEKGARRANAAVVFVTLLKKKRGYYHMGLKVFCDDASQIQEGEITAQYVKHLESMLNANPDNWLWTHRRWKRTPPPNILQENETTS